MILIVIKFRQDDIQIFNVISIHSVNTVYLELISANDFVR
jgi:hypothetical protein